MTEGWIKLHRKSLDSAVWKDPDVWRLWTWMLLEASHKPRQTLVRKVPVMIEAGQLIFSRAKAAEATKLSDRTIRTCLDVLTALGNVTSQTTNRFSMITIVNWATYQLNENANDQPNDQQTTNRRPTDDQLFLRNKKGKKKDTLAHPQAERTAMSDFDKFWEAYPKKKAKGSALKAWSKLNGTRPPLETLLSAIAAQSAGHDWQKDGGQYIPYPSTWLNGMRWEDGMTTSHDLQASKHDPAKRRLAWEQIPEEEWRYQAAPRFLDVLTAEEKARYVDTRRQA